MERDNQRFRLHCSCQFRTVFLCWCSSGYSTRNDGETQSWLANPRDTHTFFDPSQQFSISLLYPPYYTHTHSFDRTWSWRRFRPCFLSRMWSLWMPSLPWSHHPSKRQRREMGKNIYPSLLDIKDGGDICVYLSCDCKKAKSIDQPPEWGDLPEFCCCCLPRSQIRSSWLGD